MAGEEEIEDEELMRRYKAGDREAFRLLFERYAPRLYGLLRRRCRRDEDAHDLVQQTFLQLHRARHDFRADARLRPWLYTIALNLYRDAARYTGRRPEFLVEELPTQREEPDVMRRDAARRVRQAVAALPQSQREVVELHWFEEMSFGEVAEVLGISRSAAKVRAHRAYKVLRDALEGDFEGEVP